MPKTGSSKFGKLAFVALFGAMVTVGAFRAIPKPGTNLLQGVLSPLPTLTLGNPLDSTNDEPPDEARFSAIEWTTNGVDLVLHRPEDVSADALEVTLAGSTNLVTATWEPYTNVTFAAGETNLAVFVDRAMLDAHAVSNACFFAFINAGDSDEDGLADWDERFNFKTDPHSSDTDGDGMPDGWEHESGLPPNSADDDDGASGDPDGDGLSNWEEYVLGTLPLDRYSYGDGIEDQDWAAWGFGMPFSDCVSLLVTVGDSSGSSSERWKLHLDDTEDGGRHYVVACSESGQVASRTLHLERGRYFTGWIEHISSTQETPDYDWTAQVDSWPPTVVLPQGVAQTEGLRYHEDHVHSLVVDNVDGLLGICADAFGSYDNSHGKKFYLHTIKTQIDKSRVCVPFGFTFPTSFSLTEDSDQIADWTIEPQTAGGARLHVSASGGEGATSLQGVSRVYVAPGVNPGLYTITARHPTFENSYSTATFAVCKFKVEGVRFNFDRNSSDTDAINIRSNYDTLGFNYATGEWANGGQVNFPVCYKGGVLPHIQAKFSMTPAITMSARFFAQQTTFDSPLSGLVDAEVDFVDGVSSWTTFDVIQRIETKIHRSQAEFAWYCSTIAGINFLPSVITTTGPHRVYTVLADPVEPWSSNHESNQCAWTNALEWACVQAEGMVDENHCASNIVEAIFSSWCFQYDVADGGTHFTEDSGIPPFQTRKVLLMNCLRVLSGESSGNSLVNCKDCASFVTSFSNLLGCNLYNSRMGAAFTTNPFFAIGCQPWTPPSWGWGFSSHEVAWSGNCTSGDLVFDACLRYDGDDNPGQPPYVQMTPGGVPFSDGDPGPPFVYRDRLVPASSHGICNPDSAYKIRRQLK